ncbi:hypothetical protein [Propionimicrobium sp. PCR01-08-3]|uniref:hypothetical protein n=1 Tax=Propionimicrobium sp. PCR01-08-3 TaxID=3052086 RepID=UPI00255CDF57|nr:hypothetical protein [Propionimicrobium sp. PCR01-08-3]WIY83671.1 hypothetical protein QQ658_04770 [Propionimicrobium sp. PCR01-08-3]
MRVGQRGRLANAARLLRLDDQAVIRRDAAADLVVLGSDPRENTGNIADIESAEIERVEP